MKKQTKSEIKRLKKENKEFNKLFETLRSDKTLIQMHEERELREQTEQFWHLQLQFLETDTYVLLEHLLELKDSGLYVKNKKSKKMQRYLQKSNMWNSGNFLDPNQKACVATHLALQLSGLGEV